MTDILLRGRHMTSVVCLLVSRRLKDTKKHTRAY